MIKCKLAALAALTLAGAAAPAQAGNPWAAHDWSTPSSAYQAPSYWGQTPAPQVSLKPEAAAAVYSAEMGAAVDATPVSHSQAHPAPAPYAEPAYAAPLSGHPAPGAGSVYQPAPVDAYVAEPAVSGYDAGYGGCGTYDAGYGSASCGVTNSPARTWSSRGYAEALFLNADSGFTGLPAVTGSGGSLGPLGDTLGYEDVSKGSATGYRIGADLLFGNACDPWMKGVGFSYTDFGSFGGSRVGQFDNGVDFIGHPRPANHVAGGREALSDFGQFQVFRQAVAEQNAIDGQENYYGCENIFNDAGDVVRNATFRADHHLDVDAFGVNFLLADRCRKCTFGVGYRRLNVGSNGFIGITGELQSGNGANADWYDPNTASLSSQAFQNAGLTHVEGADDGIQNGQWVELLSGASAHNELNGIDFNGRVRLLCRGGFDLVGTGNVGVYQNNVDARVFQRFSELEGGGNSRYGRTADVHDSVVSFAAGLGLTGGYWVTDCLRVYGGYEVNWISGIALAPEQAFTENSYHLKHNGDLLLHGAKVGVEYCY